MGRRRVRQGDSKCDMCAGRVAGYPNFPDNLTLLHFIIFMYKVFLVVRIHGHNTVGMFENDHITIAALLAGIRNLTIQYSFKWCSFRTGDIESFMGLSITCAESRSDLSSAGPDDTVFLKFGFLYNRFGNDVFELSFLDWCFQIELLSYKNIT